MVQDMVGIAWMLSVLVMAGSFGGASPNPEKGTEPRIKRKPSEPVRIVADTSELFGPDTYPPEARRIDMEGLVSAKISINAQSRVTDCTHVSPAYEILGDATCRIVMEHPDMFLTATDRRGRPVPSSHTLHVRWQLPKQEPMRSHASRVDFIVESDGKISSCAETTYPADPEAHLCQQLPSVLGTFVAIVSGQTGAARSRAILAVDTIIGDGPLLTGDMPADMIRGHETRTRFDIDKDGHAVNCRTVVSVAGFDNTAMITPCHRRLQYIVDAGMARSGYHMVRLAYRPLP